MSQSLIELMDESRQLKKKIEEVGKMICPEAEYLDNPTPFEILDHILGSYTGAVSCAEELKCLIDRLIKAHGLDDEPIMDEIHQIWVRCYS